ncbi:MAG: alpha/beta hydrolase [bacterium]
MKVHPAVILLVLLAAAWFALRRFESVSIYFPDRTEVFSPGTYGLRPSEVMLASSDGKKISAWYFPPADEKPVLLFCHGNGGNISYCLDKIKALLGTGAGVFIFDYRGYGKSSGRPCEKGLYLDAEAALRWLASSAKISPGRIIIYGESLGCAVAVELAGRNPSCGGLVLESPFTSMQEMGRKVYPFLPVRLIVTQKYDSISKMPMLRCPLLVLHSREDEIIPFEMGRKIFEAAHVPKEFVTLRGGHNDGWAASGNTYLKAIKSFMGKVGRR